MGTFYAACEEGRYLLTAGAATAYYLAVELGPWPAALTWTAVAAVEPLWLTNPAIPGRGA